MQTRLESLLSQVDDKPHLRTCEAINTWAGPSEEQTSTCLATCSQSAEKWSDLHSLTKLSNLIYGLHSSSLVPIEGYIHRPRWLAMNITKLRLWRIKSKRKATVGSVGLCLWAPQTRARKYLRIFENNQAFAYRHSCFLVQLRLFAARRQSYSRVLRL